MAWLDYPECTHATCGYCGREVRAASVGKVELSGWTWMTFDLPEHPKHDRPPTTHSCPAPGCLEKFDAELAEYYRVWDECAERKRQAKKWPPAPKMPRHIRDRYFRTTIGHPLGVVCHHGDCRIYSAVPAFCSCGLLHDLESVSEPQVIYPPFYDELRRQDDAHADPAL